MRLLILGIVLGCVVTANFAESVRGSLISELRLGQPGTSQAYVEIFMGTHASTFSLVVLDANPSRDNLVRSVITIDPDPNASLLLLHEGSWSGSLASTVQEMSLGANALRLGGDSSGASRRLVILGGTVDWAVDSYSAPHPVSWASDSSVPPVLDVVTYRLGTWPVASAFGEDVWQVSQGDAAWRIVSEQGEYTHSYVVGAVDDLGRFSTGEVADPGYVNAPVVTQKTENPPSPEPATAALLGSCLVVLSVRRRCLCPT